MATKDEIKAAAEADLATFIRLIDPMRLLSHCHEDVIRWWEREDRKTHQLLLFPRDHMKSAMVAYRTVWRLTKDPTLRVLYISSTSNLAEKQLGFMKRIFTNDIYRRYWPEMVNFYESQRERWTTSEVSLDHPLRAKENIRDPSIFTAGLTTGLTGLHFDIAVLDDVVVKENAYTNEGREKVKSQYSLLASIEAADSEQWVVGTRYHPRDLYNDMMTMQYDVYNDEGEIIHQEPVYEVYEEVVENVGDGTGEFLWPRQRRNDGKWFGFDRSVLARKRAQYLDRTQYRAQYYNDPTDPDNRPIDYDKFQYYDRKFLTNNNGHWFYKNSKLNLFAAIDFAYSTKVKSDFTAIVVIGVNEDNDLFVLDISRFKTDKISDYYKELLHLLSKWSFRKLRAECTAAQAAIVRELKENYLKPNGITLQIEEYKPTRYDGAKEERMTAVLEPRYDNMQVYHYRGGNCQLLEDELVTNHPAHDDIKDALANAVTIAVKPTRHPANKKTGTDDNVLWHPRFGGRAF